MVLGNTYYFLAFFRSVMGVAHGKVYGALLLLGHGHLFVEVTSSLVKQ
jgi:hypothetical protein